MAIPQPPGLPPQAMPGQAPAGGPPDAADAAGAPGGAPMTTPQQPKGLQQAAKVHVSMSMDLLSQSLPALGPDTEEGQAVIKALGTLGKAFGKSQDKSRELVPAEILQLLSALPQAGGASPGAKQAAATPPPGLGAPQPA